MNIANWIAGLMSENTDALGFIPLPTLQYGFVAKHRYILQADERGNSVGYLLHGPVHFGCPVYINQHCIQYEKRLRGYGERAFQELLNRAQQRQASVIRLRCADDLSALQFWQQMGFTILRVVPGGKRRNRMIVEMFFPLNLPLIGGGAE